jgi:MFS family permease
MIIMGAGTMALVFVDRALDFVAIRLIQGIGRAMVIPASMVLIATGSEEGARGGTMGLYSTILMAGLGIGPVFGGGLHAGWGPEAALCSSGTLSITGAILMQILIPKAQSEALVEKNASSIAGRGTVSADVVGLSIAMFLVANSFSMIAGLENEFNTRLQQSVLGFSVAFSAFTFTRLIVQLPLGRLADRVGYRPLISVGLAVLAPATALLGYARTTSQFAEIRVLQGLAAAAVAVPSLALGARISGTQVKGKQLGIITMSFGLGMAFGPLVASALSLLFFEFPFLLSGILTLVSAWIVHRFVSSQVEEQVAG